MSTVNVKSLIRAVRDLNRAIGGARRRGITPAAVIAIDTDGDCTCYGHEQHVPDSERVVASAGEQIGAGQYIPRCSLKAAAAWVAATDDVAAVQRDLDDLIAETL